MAKARQRGPRGVAKALYLRRGHSLAFVIAASVLVALGWAVFWRTPNPALLGEAKRPVQPAALGSRPERVVEFREGCVNSSCHAAMSTAPVRHASIDESACNVCHAPDSGGHIYPLLAERDGLCTGCHAVDEHRVHQHRALAADGCLGCHDPHGSSAAGLLRRPTLNETCAQCHPHTKAIAAHEPYSTGRCDACHEPHGSDVAKLLTGGEGPRHCWQCHAEVVERMESAPNAHCAVDGQCIACHAPHGGDHPKLLPAPPKELCTSCHPKVAQAVNTATVSHDAVLHGQQCITCHDPHASEFPSMLRANQTDVCLSCHDKSLTAADGRSIPAMGEVIRNSPIVHGAIQHGDCSACHAIHGATQSRLLKQPTEKGSGVALVAGESRTFALCFECHDPTLIAPGGTTQFRDGSRNLHDVHLRDPKKSRGCGSCHAAHGASSPRLMATTVNFQGSGWAMPMRFELTDDGGSCAPGCHEKLGYSRSGTDPAAPTAPQPDLQTGAPR